MALRNRENKETFKLRGVDRSINPTKLEMGKFTALANWIPAKLYSIKKKRGVLALSTTAVVQVPIDLCGSTCVDSTFRGQQVITIETAFDQVTPTVGNLRTSWGHISNGEVYTLVGESTCNGGSMGYNNTCCWIYHFQNDNPVLLERLTIPNPGGGSFINTRIGASDRPVWAADSNEYSGLRVHYYDPGAHTAVAVDYDTPSTNFGGHNDAHFAIKGGEVWIVINCCLDGGPPVVELAVFNRATGTKLRDYYPFGNDSVAMGNLHLTDNFAYVLGTLNNVTKIYKINRASGAIAGQFDITGLSTQFIAVASDDLIYILCSGTPAKVYYLKNFTDLIYVGKTTGVGFVPFDFGTGIFNNNTIYYGSNGFGGFTTDIFKIAIGCPDVLGSPLIASISAGSASVAAGSPINVTWADILLPDATDRIDLRPAPAAGALGFSGASLANLSTGALAGGTLPFTIPGGTTPGSYIFQLTTQAGGILISTSTPFTVT